MSLLGLLLAVAPGSVQDPADRAAGCPRESFGFSDPALRDLDPKGPLSELLA